MSSLKPATSAFVLAAAITILFNTALAWAKDANPALTSFMASITGHHQWITHGLADLVLFVALGMLFLKTGIAQEAQRNLLTGALIVSALIGVLGLLLWYVFV